MILNISQYSNNDNKIIDYYKIKIIIKIYEIKIYKIVKKIIHYLKLIQMHILISESKYTSEV